MASRDLVQCDLESSKEVDLSHVLSKSDDVSVSTRQSDSDSDSASHHPAELRRRTFKKWRTLALVAVLAAVLGLSVGLGLGLRVGKEESRNVERAVNTDKTSETTDSPVDDESGAIGDNKVLQPEEYQDAVVEDSGPVDDEPEAKDDEPEAKDDSKSPPMNIGFESTTENVSWPELLRRPADEVKKIIEDEDEGYDVIIVGPGEPTTKDLREDRVFLFTNEEGYVIRVPRPGR